MIEKQLNKPELTRREFSKRFGVGLVAGATLAAFPWFESIASSNNQDKVKVAVIGTGSRGTLLLEMLLMNSHAEVVAICDDYIPNLTRAALLTKKKAKIFWDYREILKMKEVEAVVIATPLHLHAKMTIEFLNVGKHVFCEKSMAMTIDDCVAMYETHKKTGLILQIGHQRLFSPKYIDAISRIQNGEIGKIGQIRAYWHRNGSWRRSVPNPTFEKKINWRLYNEFSRGLMTELASHQVQVANWILKEVPKSVIGYGGNNYWFDGREVYDNVALIYKYESGTNLIYDSITSNAHYGCEEQIMGNKGTMELEINKKFSENPPRASAFAQLINDIEHKIFDAIPIGGATWVPETASVDKGEPIYNKMLNSDGTDFSIEGFLVSVKNKKIIPGLAEHGLNASISVLIGHQAMVENKEIVWPL